MLSLPPLDPGLAFCCPRCHARLPSADLCAANARARHAVLAALILYPLAVGLPILRVERLGRVHESSVWSGSLGLVADGKLALGLLIFLCSVVLPLVKLVALWFLLEERPRLAPRARHRLWRALELCGRFGMLDVLLVSILVAWIELGAWVQVRSGPAAWAFGACVLFSLLAGAWLEPASLWRAPRERDA